jgi:hypothetical protein
MIEAGTAVHLTYASGQLEPVPHCGQCDKWLATWLAPGLHSVHSQEPAPMFSSSLSSMNKARMVLDISTCVPNKALEITSLTRRGCCFKVRR